MICYASLCQTAAESINRNKTRSILTTLGVIIGVLSVILLSSIGNGIRNFVTEQFNDLGANTVYVTPGEIISEEGGFSQASDASQQNSKLEMEHVEAIKKLGNEIIAAVPYTEVQGDVRFKTRKRRTLVIATQSDYSQIRNTPAEKGRFFKTADEDAKRKVAVIGPEVAEKLFDNKDPIGKDISINDIRFTVIGVTESKGGGGFGGPSFDNTVFIPLSTGQSFLEIDSVSSILIQVDNQENISLAMKRIEKTLLQRLDEDEFSLLDQNELMKTIDQILSTLTLGLTGIAAISLIVGGIGIMNIMLVSVAERTREIGLRKALGATPQIIMFQFLIESAILSSLGGIIGITLGFLGTLALSSFLPAAVTLVSVLIAFGVSFLVGIIFGVIPARKAAALSPIEALRYE